MSFVRSRRNPQCAVQGQSVMGRKRRANASSCRANCLESILRGRGWDPSVHRPLMEDQHWKLQEATTEHTGSSRSPPPPTLTGLLEHHQVFNSYSAWRNGSEGCISTCCPLSRSVITWKSLHVGNGRRALEEMLNSVRPHQSHSSLHYRSL